MNIFGWYELVLVGISSVLNFLFKGQMELLIHCLFFIGIRELKLRQIEINIIFDCSRQNSDEMAISCKCEISEKDGRKCLLCCITECGLNKRSPGRSVVQSCC